MSTQAKKSKFFIRQEDVLPYHPANHTGTTNYRLVGPGTVGKAQLELVLGVIEKGRGALPHRHPGIDQVCYLLEGRALAEVAGESCELGPGECCFFPADASHSFTVTSDTPVRVLVIYAPPYGEAPEKTIKA